MKTIHSISLVAAVVVVALLVINVPVYASRMDDSIESSAKKSYVFKTYLKADDIKIKSKDGVVSLTGTVSEDSHKSLAQETVASLPGVKSVNNELEVKGEPPAEKSDTWISAKVKTTLLFHRNVSAKTEVTTQNGIVTLQGNASSQAQKDLTTEYVKGVEGVMDVKNEMQVSKTSKKERRTTGEKIDDASITALVKMTLLNHRSTSALNTKVTTKRGVVTLDGTAGSAAESDLATKLAKDVKGVNDVKNRMSVK